MFTNEIEEFGTKTTVLDEEDNFEDIIMEIQDDMVTLRQYNDDLIPDYITISHKMFKDLLEALNKPEGLYKTRYGTNSILDSIK